MTKECGECHKIKEIVGIRTVYNPDKEETENYALCDECFKNK